MKLLRHVVGGRDCWLAAAFTVLTIGLGCASAEKARLLSTADADRLVAECETAVIGTVISSEGVGRKYIENYLLGSNPARAKIYANVVFRIEKLIVGNVEASELQLENVLVNGESFLFRIGDQYFVGFNGKVSNPRKVLLMPVRNQDESVNQ